MILYFRWVGGTQGNRLKFFVLFVFFVVKKKFKFILMNQQPNREIIFKEESYKIQGAVFEVYREMGSGFLENVYQECLEKEFKKLGIPFVPQQEITLTYKGEILKQTYKPYFLCYQKIIVELKAVKETSSEHKAQAINYLKATGLRLALLVNFGAYPKASVLRLAR